MVADGARIGANNGGGDGSEVVGEERLGRGAAEPVHSGVVPAGGLGLLGGRARARGGFISSFFSRSDGQR